MAEKIKFITIVNDSGSVQYSVQISRSLKGKDFPVVKMCLLTLPGTVIAKCALLSCLDKS